MSATFYKKGIILVFVFVFLIILAFLGVYLLITSYQNYDTSLLLTQTEFLAQSYKNHATANLYYEFKKGNPSLLSKPIFNEERFSYKEDGVEFSSILAINDLTSKININSQS